MWSDIFHLEPSILEKILRPLFIYLFLLIAIRIGGQRELGQNNALQFVLLLSVANAVQNGIIGVDDSVTGAVVGAITLFLANGVVELLTSRSLKMHALIIGRPIQLVTHGVINRRTLRRQRLSEEDLREAATRVGITSLHDIDHAILTSDGDITVTPKSSRSMHEEISELQRKIDLLLIELKNRNS